MTTNEEMKAINKTARIAGLLYLLELPLGIFGIIYVPSVLFVAGDAIATVNSIMANESLFRLSIVSALVVQLVNVFVVLLLFKLLKPVNINHAVLMVVFLLLAVPIAMLNEVNNFAVMLLSSNAGYLPGFTADQMHGLVPLFLDLHKFGVSIASIFWGLWLFPMGYLVFKSGYIPKILGILLIIAGVGYLIDFVVLSLFPTFDVTISTFTGYGEIIFALWLLIKGVNVGEWEKRALKST
jgi:hypothetical protein